MKKIIISIFALCTCLTSQVNAETYLSDYFETVYDESLQNESFPLDKKIQDKYQVIAKHFGDNEESKGKNDSVNTNIVTYEVLDTGVLVHIGWYVDGFIITALDGTEEGKQVIIINGSVVGISYDVKVNKSYFTHNYTWAKVTSYSNKQTIKNK